MEIWKDKIMDSLDGLEKASPANDVFANIEQRIHTQKTKYAREWVAVAAAVLVVVCTNGYFVLTNDSNTTQTVSATGYPEIVTDFNIYK